MRTLDRLEEWSELPDEIHVLELGVGDGQQAKVWLDAFAGACAAQGRDYPLVTGLTVVVAAIAVATTLLVDIAYTRIDPRVRIA